MNAVITKCLSLKQPYAELLVSGKKTIEVRKWKTKFRGQFHVHASKNIDEEACKRLKIDQTKLVTGAIIGKATEALQAIIEMDNKLLVAMSDNPPPMLEKSTGNDNNN